MAATVVWPAVGLGQDGSDIVIASLVSGADAGVWTLIAEGELYDELIVDEDMGWTLGAGHIWYVSDYGEPVNEAAVTAAEPFADQVNNVIGDPIPLTVDESFYLAFALYGTVTAYGWAELMYDGTTLILVDSAAELDGVGLYTGTYTPIPEPATGALALAGLAALGRHRARRRRDAARNAATTDPDRPL